MKTSLRARAAGLLLAIPGLTQAPALRAEEAASPLIPTADGWELVISPYAYHFSHSPEHKHVYLIGLERQRADNWLWGGAYFSNSFGQDSGVGYVGYMWNNVFDIPALYFKLVAGIMYGYKEPYEDKVPFNHNGWSPVILPSVGWRFTPKDSVQVVLLGGNGMLFSYNRRF
ncbi:hypothetical protein [Variovorax sp.]|uniref:hypothetical protein n=1 Tax=Variovorax sp. TaxID=1871043 RepID=UPI002D45EF8D|nr:hypothetical protein [Variovorax sp.]HYP84424.1 hypothetical protein [Variovorax sp.]